MPHAELRLGQGFEFYPQMLTLEHCADLTYMTLCGIYKSLVDSHTHK